jgi:hypothetical protein
VTKDEIKLLGKVRNEYDRFIAVVTRVVELIRGSPPGRSPANRMSKSAAEQNLAFQFRMPPYLDAHSSAPPPDCRTDWTEAQS